MVQSDMVRVSKNGNLYDRYRGRVMFPIFDLRGNVVAFGGRILTDEKPKYINTSDTPVYHKSSGLFAMNFAKDAGTRQLILAEGYMDVIASAPGGVYQRHRLPGNGADRGAGPGHSPLRGRGGGLLRLRRGGTPGLRSGPFPF